LSVLTLVKYQGLGNDFLIALDGGAVDEAARELGARDQFVSGRAASPAGGDRLGRLVSALCDRHTGVGADGLLVLRPALSGGDIGMELRNADGGRAETSGNGLRCMAMAAVDSDLVSGTEFAIETAAGVHRVVLGRRDAPGLADVSVEMGRLKVLQLPPVSDVALPGSATQPWPSWFVDVGNPHLVVFGPSLSGVDVAAIGPRLEAERPGGQNVEITTFEPESGDLTMVVWERGAGVTLACGTGSAAAAAALHAAGISAARVRVHNPGGIAEVTLTGNDRSAPLAQLAGPVRRVARVEVDPADVGASEAVVVAS
jgi:diaminopimelate epimerase